MKNEQTVDELREVAYQEIVDLFEGDSRAADRWLSSSVRALGNHPPISLMGTKPGIQKIRNTVRKWSEGAVS
ncbi:MAG: MbcA/ParS/Xre antitoxin family protein [Marinobacter sp.]|uniref:MbcA/ParS/Xre antitoxin family protein n=1 Tax=Marinobacter sp. TaxID=50741 RepID=UPI0032970195